LWGCNRHENMLSAPLFFGQFFILVKNKHTTGVDKRGTLFFILFMRACTTVLCCRVVDVPE
jgi:hypothetical protein